VQGFYYDFCGGYISNRLFVLCFDQAVICLIAPLVKSAAIRLVEFLLFSLILPNCMDLLSTFSNFFTGAVCNEANEP